MRECSRGVGSRIQGCGALLRSLRGLLGGVERYGQHRAATAAERVWSVQLPDALGRAWTETIKNPGARSSFAFASARARVARKSPVTGDEARP